MNIQVLDARSDARGGYKVDVSRGEQIGRVSSEWFSRPADERYLSLSELAHSVRDRRGRGAVGPVQAAPGVVHDAHAAADQVLVDRCQPERAVDLVALPAAVVLRWRVADDAGRDDLRPRGDAAGPLPERLARGDLLEDLLHECEQFVGKPAALMTKDERIRAIGYLDRRGAFLISKSSERACEFFGISKYSFYSYLNEAKAATGDK